MKIIVMALAATVIALSGYSQKIQEKDLPVAVKESFHKSYASAKQVKWDKEKENYEASFDWNGADHSVLYNAEGQTVETEVEIKVSELPAAAKQYMETHYNGKTIKEAAKITDAKQVITYEAEIKGMDVLFDAQGKFIKTVKD
jgi:hypothetical protein